MRKLLVIPFLLIANGLMAGETSPEAEADTMNIALQEQIAYMMTLDSIVSTFEADSSGKVELFDGMVSLDIPEGFVFLKKENANTVLQDLWGNPPSTATAGMLLPINGGFFGDSSFAITIDYTDEGHVKDEEAESINYDEMLTELQEATSENSKQRVEQGYETIELVGWAANPYYDQVNKKLHWAKELKFGDSELNTLNYDIRVLGREGYVNLTFIANIDQLGLINSDVDKIISSVDFNAGNKYLDFNEDTDRTAEYGIAGLVAGGVLMKAVKLGFFAKFWKFILLGIGALLAGLKKIFGGNKDK